MNPTTTEAEYFQVQEKLGTHTWEDCSYTYGRSRFNTEMDAKQTAASFQRHYCPLGTSRKYRVVHRKVVDTVV